MGESWICIYLLFMLCFRCSWAQPEQDDALWKTFVNHLFFVDDLCVLGPILSGFQHFLHICCDDDTENENLTLQDSWCAFPHKKFKQPNALVVSMNGASVKFAKLLYWKVTMRCRVKWNHLVIMYQTNSEVPLLSALLQSTLLLLPHVDVWVWWKWNITGNADKHFYHNNWELRLTWLQWPQYVWYVHEN